MKNNEFLRNPHLAGDDFFWEGNDTGILLIHGFTATTAEVCLLAEKLHQQGYTTSGPLLPGHGTHPDELNRTKMNAWIEKVDQAYQSLSAQCGRVFVIGESMGALLAMVLGAKYHNISGLLLFAPAIKVNNLWTARFLAPFKQHLVKTHKDDGLPWQGYDVYPLKAAVEMLKLQKYTQNRLSEITQPTYIYTAAFDQTIAPDSAKVIMEGIRSEDKRHIHMSQSGHCILLDKELAEVADQVIAFIQSH